MTPLTKDRITVWGLNVSSPYVQTKIVHDVRCAVEGLKHELMGFHGHMAAEMSDRDRAKYIAQIIDEWFPAFKEDEHVN
jgi:hypothetical protein